MITGERGREGQLTRYGIEEYVSDCVIVLDHRVRDEIATRRLRVVKYRGSVARHQRVPLPDSPTAACGSGRITSVALTYDVSTERVSLGVPQLDEMLGGGVYSRLHRPDQRDGRHRQDDAGRPGGRRGLRPGRDRPCSSPSRSRRTRSSATCGRSASTSGAGSTPGCSGCGASGPPRSASRHTSTAIERLLDETEPTVAVLDAVGSLSPRRRGAEVTSHVVRELDMLKSRGITGDADQPDPRRAAASPARRRSRR